MLIRPGNYRLKKFPEFVERRKHNFRYLHHCLEQFQDQFILPQACENSDPSWFGFMLTCREGIERNQVVLYLEEHGVQTRMLFAGNLIRHPCFDQMRASKTGYRVAGGLENTDRVMRDSFWIGVYPGMTDEKLDYMVKMIEESIMHA